MRGFVRIFPCFLSLLVQALYSYLLAKKYYALVACQPLQAEMVSELLLLARCCSTVGAFEEGRLYLDELRLLVENTLAGRAAGGSGDKAKAVPKDPRLVGWPSEAKGRRVSPSASAGSTLNGALVVLLSLSSESISAVRRQRLGCRRLRHGGTLRRV